MSELMTKIYKFDFKDCFKIMCKTYSLLFCFMQTYLLLFPMFMLAWSSGTYESTLNINMYGEADIEMVIWAITFPFIIYGMYLNGKCIMRN